MSWFTSWFSGQENNSSGVDNVNNQGAVLPGDTSELPKEEKSVFTGDRPETQNEDEKNQQAAAIPINIPVIPLTGGTDEESNTNTIVNTESTCIPQAEAESTAASEQQQQPMNNVETETKESPLEEPKETPLQEPKQQPDVEFVVFQPQPQPQPQPQSQFNSSSESELSIPKLERESFTWDPSILPIPFVTIDTDVKTKKAPLESSTQALEIMLLKKETDRLTRNLNHSRLLYQQLSEKFSAKTLKSDKMHDALLKQIVELRAENESLRKLVPKEKHLTQPKHKVIKTKQQRKAEAKKMRYNLQERSRAKMMDEQEDDEDDE